MRFNYKSEPNQNFEKEGENCADHQDYMCTEEDCSGEMELLDIHDFFATGQADDTIAGHFLELDHNTGVITIQGELSPEEIEDISSEAYYGSTPEGYEVKQRLDVFTDEWSIQWEECDLFDEEGEEL